ncbi:MAG: PAS domain S-box protein [Bradyrhizobium sp.]|nr:PAS domain S-box protein [Bradyrhizobium sp.]
MTGDPEAILDLAAESIFTRGLDGRILTWNKASEEVYGWSKQAAIGQHAQEFLKTAFSDPAIEAQAQAIEHGAWEGEITRVTEAGKTLHILARWSVRCGADGAPLDIVETGRDVTALRTSEAALRYSEHRYHNLFGAMAASFWELDFSGVVRMVRGLNLPGFAELRAHLRDHPAFVREMMRATRVIDVNQHTVGLFGAAEKEQLLGNVEPFWPPESTQDYAEGVLQAMSRNANYTTECKLRKADGSTFDALFTAAYPPQTAGKGTVLVGVIDITARKKAFAKLEESESRYRSLFYNMPVSLWRMDSSRLIAVLADLRRQGVTDLDGYMDAHPGFLAHTMNCVEVAEVNQSTLDLFGARDLADMKIPVERYWKSSPQTFRNLIVARFRGDQTFEEETQMNALDGRPIDGLFTVAFPPALNELGISLNAFVDATERVRAQQMLQRVQADFAHASRVSMLGELTASIAHEVNQPLAAIATNAGAGMRWLDRPVPNVDEVRALTGSILADARRAADIIARVRRMATRRDTGMVELSVSEIIEESLRFLSHELQARGVSVSLELESGAPPVWGDRTQLQQVLVNLVVNAVQSMSGTGARRPAIRIETALADPATLHCCVEDSGPGIGADHFGRLFDSFFTTRQDGMGMGLRICRSIIEAHGGRIEADNDARIGGARFSFTLPVAKDVPRRQ